MARPQAEQATGERRSGPAAQFADRLIAGYQRWLSPAMGAHCRFYPSCSSYAREAIANFGVLKGGRLALWRLLRCQPLSRGGYDPVPPSRPAAAGGPESGDSG